MAAGRNYTSHQIYPLRIFGFSQVQNCSLCRVHGDLRLDSSLEPESHHPDSDGLPPTYTHVCLPQQLFLLRVLLCHFHNPQNALGLLQEACTHLLYGCTVWHFLFSSWGLTECCLLAAMAYDRYIAICSPLLYTATMCPSLYVQTWQDLYNWIPWLIHSVVCLTSAPLLWTTCYPSLLL